jgi:hypothetical protein
MTIIHPNSNYSRMLLFVLIVSLIPLFTAATYLIFAYNKNVDARHKLSSMQESLKAAELQGADLREATARTINQTGEEFAASRGLVREIKPRYIVQKPQGWDTAITLSLR